MLYLSGRLRYTVGSPLALEHTMMLALEIAAAEEEIQRARVAVLHAVSRKEDAEDAVADAKDRMERARTRLRDLRDLNEYPDGGA